MTHHFNNKDKESREGVEGDIIDQSEVDQGAKELPAQPASLIELPEEELERVAGGSEEDGEEENGKKGKKSSKKKSGESEDKATESGIYKARYNSELAKNKDKINCGNCNNPMNFSADVTVVPVEGKKIPKNDKGEYSFRSPGASKNEEMVGVLCDTCMTHGKASGTMAAVTIKSIVAVGKDGNIRNIRVKDLA